MRRKATPGANSLVVCCGPSRPVFNLYFIILNCKVASDGRAEARAFDHKNPLQITEWTGDDEIQQLFGGDLTRQCRGTPVKERAINAGVTLPPTPPSTRPTIRDGSPGSKKLARKQLQRHQKSCHQRVERAEKTADEGSSQCEQFRAKRLRSFIRGT